MPSCTALESAVHESPRLTASPRVTPSPRAGNAGNAAGPRIRLFEDALLEKEYLSRTSKPAELLVALVIHVALIGGSILAGLYYADAVDMRAFTTTLRVGSPPPPPPPAAPAAADIKTQAPKGAFTRQGKLLAPTYIPKQVAEIREAPLESDFSDGIPGGVPGGVPGGQLGGVIGGIVGSAAQTRVPVPPAALSTKTAIRVGGKIRTPRILMKTTPEYPPLAKATRTQGVVKIDAIIDEKGNVVELRAVSGPPLLIHAALDAVKSWKFEPTYLDDAPTSVELNVTVTFELNH